MAITDTARRNHAQLFGEGTSALARTDPELIDYFDNWAFDETLAHAEALDAGVDLHTRLLVQLAACVAAGGLGEFRALATAAITRGLIESVELKELVYQAVAYLGIARVLDYLHAANDVLTAAGIELPLPGQSTTDPANRLRHGASVQERIVGPGRVQQMHAAAPQDQRHFQRYLTGNCFGDTVARSGLNLRTRELLTFAMLASLGGADAQLRGHVTGNLNVGNSRASLLAVLTVLVPYIGYPRTLNALTAINDITKP